MVPDHDVTGTRLSYAERVRWVVAFYTSAALTLAAMASAVMPAAASNGSRRGSMPAISSAFTTVSTNVVANPSGASGTSGWSAYSQSGKVAVRSVTGVTGPFTYATAISISRPNGTGEWAMALGALQSPTTFFVVGRTYRMQMWVRDVTGSGKGLVLLLRNSNYGHRPTDAHQAAAYADTGWHLISRTFICTSPAESDTAFYVELPDSGSFDFEFTGAAVASVTAPLPAHVTTAPSTSITFAGPAGSEPDSTVWNQVSGGNGWGNDEVETYTTSTANAQLDGAGRLNLITRRRTVVGTDGIQRDFTSARLNTQGKVDIPAGSYVEASIQAATGAGLWPAFWLVGANFPRVGWPQCGELDVFEGWGSDPTIAHAAIHMSSPGDPSVDTEYGWGEAGGTTQVGTPLDAKPHLYGVYFDENVVQFYVDHVPTMTVWASDTGAAERAWPFGQPQTIVLNVAVVGDVDTSRTVFPTTTTIDRISAWSGGLPF